MPTTQVTLTPTLTQVKVMAVCSSLAVIFSFAGMMGDDLYESDPFLNQTAPAVSGIWRGIVVPQVYPEGGDHPNESSNGYWYLTTCTIDNCFAPCCKRSQSRCKANQALSILGFLPGFAAFLLSGLSLRGRNPGMVGTFANLFAGFCYFCIWTVAIANVSAEGPEVNPRYQSPICVAPSGIRLGLTFNFIVVASFFFVAAGILNVISAKSAGYEDFVPLEPLLTLSA